MEKNESLKGIIPFLKTDERIMAFLKANYYDRELCLESMSFISSDETLTELIRLHYSDHLIFSAAVKLIKSDKIVFDLMRKCCFDYESCQEYVSGLRFAEKTDDEIMVYVEKSAYALVICEAAIPYLKLDKNILEVYEKCRSNQEIVELILNHLNSWKNALKILEKHVYYWVYCLAASKFLKTDKRLIEMMEKTSYRLEFIEGIIPLLNLSSRSEARLVSLAIKTNFSSYIMTAILEVIDLKSKTEKQLETFLKKYRYDAFLEEGIKYVSTAKALEIMKESSYKVGICVSGIMILKSDEDRMMVMENSGYNSRVCRVGIQYLKSDDYIMQIMEKTNYSENICGLGIARLKSEENILAILEKFSQGPNGKMVCKSGSPLLNLSDKIENQIICIMERTNFQPDVIDVCLPILQKLQKQEMAAD